LDLIDGTAGSPLSTQAVETVPETTPLNRIQSELASQSPTEMNSPTRYELFEARPPRNRIPTWKVREAGGWPEIMRQVGRPSCRRRKRKSHGKKQDISKGLYSISKNYKSSFNSLEIGRSRRSLSFGAISGNSQNKFLDPEGDMIFPSVDELFSMDLDDIDLFQQAFN
jgi:hypothetical protein